MKKTACAVVLLMLAGLAAAATPNPQTPIGRLLTGRVVDQDDRPLPNAVVYLTDTRTRAVKTYIAGKDGDYRFPGLSPNLDYEVYAQYNGHKSDTKTVSQFDNRSTVNINLKINTK
jgi:Carboxypeptidase regulatory-like domain